MYPTNITLNELLSSDNDTIKSNAKAILTILQSSPTKDRQQEYFPITSVHRNDLDGLGYDTSEVDDETMTNLASKMADAYCDEDFWIDLPIIADHHDIPQKK